MSKRSRRRAGRCAAGVGVATALATGVLALHAAPAAAVACTDLCPIVENQPDSRSDNDLGVPGGGGFPGYTPYDSDQDDNIPGASPDQGGVDAAERDLPTDNATARQDQVLRSDAGLTEMLTELLPGYRIAPQAIARFIVPPNQFDSFDQIITHESSWNMFAINPSSGAYGLPQALPAYKMFSAGLDWPFNPVTQIRWAYEYMNQRYGSPNAAWVFWQRHHWY
ncbi:transglycosylase SLT domain-containing protein [Nocardia sp. alder85J]|uniref:aggregation-promoting factor C-terminal-like domain-containing protein n=1 Tax=Nocardia sp. alder85J TaxID=2862949 RepID=UPI001CD48F0D|nr:transglycosylase SLT domain-containing protein [Nocardia sp. alder85J]MCX4095937.1 transglycosylase SLT domain-containing protein [Nocardia sp. alder85J]